MSDFFVAVSIVTVACMWYIGFLPLVLSLVSCRRNVVFTIIFVTTFFSWNYPPSCCRCALRICVNGNYGNDVGSSNGKSQNHIKIRSCSHHDSTNPHCFQPCLTPRKFSMGNTSTIWIVSSASPPEPISLVQHNLCRIIIEGRWRAVCPCVHKIFGSRIGQLKHQRRTFLSVQFVFFVLCTASFAIMI